MLKKRCVLEKMEKSGTFCKETGKKSGKVKKPSVCVKKRLTLPVPSWCGPSGPAGWDLKLIFFGRGAKSAMSLYPDS